MIKEQILDDIIKVLIQQNSDLTSWLTAMMVKLVLVILHLQAGFVGMAKMMHATSYNGVYVWKISEIKKLEWQARIGQTMFLYSAPFYTSRYGYKVCLKLIINGSGLEFILLVMKGEYDAILPWPFKQKVMLMLLDQGRASNNMIMPFELEQNSQRPRSETNTAFRCPLCIGIHILGNSSYVKDDTLFIRCIIGNQN